MAAGRMMRRTGHLIALLALVLAGSVALPGAGYAAGAAADAAADAQAMPVTMAATDAQFGRMVGQLVELDPAIARYDQRPQQVAFIKPLVRFLGKIARGVKKLAGVIKKAVQKMIAIGKTIQQAVSEIAHGIATGVARVIFKPLPRTIRNILVVAAGAYGEALLTGKFWGTRIGRGITKWVGKLDRINGRLDKLRDRMDKLQECLRNPLTCRWTQEKIDKEMSRVRRDRIAQQRDKIRVIERIRDIRHGIRPPPRVPVRPPTPPMRTTEGTGRRG